MNTRVLSHKGFQGSIEVSVEDNCLFGKILHIDDLVTYEGDTPTELASAFEDAVRDYLQMCEEEGREANKPFKGSLNIRIGIETHQEAAKQALELGVSLNDYIKEAVENRNNTKGVHDQPIVHHHEHHHFSVAASTSNGEFIFAEETSQWQTQKPTAH